MIYMLYHVMILVYSRCLPVIDIYFYINTYIYTHNQIIHDMYTYESCRLEAVSTVPKSSPTEVFCVYKENPCSQWSPGVDLWQWRHTQIYQMLRSKDNGIPAYWFDFFRILPNSSHLTLPETHELHLKENGWLEDDPFLLGRPSFRCYVRFREGIY